MGAVSAYVLISGFEAFQEAVQQGGLAQDIADSLLAVMDYEAFVALMQRQLAATNGILDPSQAVTVTAAMVCFRNVWSKASRVVRESRSGGYNGFGGYASEAITLGERLEHKFAYGSRSILGSLWHPSLTRRDLPDMAQIKLKWNKEEFDITIEEGSTVEVFKTQVWTLTQVPMDRQKFLGFPGGMLKDTDDLMAKVAKLKSGAKVTLMGTPEGKELKAPEEKVVFEEDLSPEEKARILKEKKVEIPPAGIKNLGNTCYMNATLQCLNRVGDLREALNQYQSPGTEVRDIDSVLTAQLRSVNSQLTSTTDSIVPMQFVMALRQRFPRFAEMQNGAPMQQDADECLRGLLTTLSGTLKGSSESTNRIDELFGYKIKSTLRCLECDEEAPQETEEMSRVLLCHLGTQTDPVSHITQGVQLSLKEHIEKQSPVLGRNAQYEKSSSIASLPPFLVVQFARFGYKGANEWAGTSASKVKLTRKCAFTHTFDIFDCTSDDVKKRLSVGRVKKKEQEDKELERQKAALDKSSSAKEDVEMKPAEDSEMQPVGLEELDTGYYQLIGIVSHKGRTADGGHYVGWTLHKKADGKDLKDDKWVLFDDDDVTFVNWKDMTGMSTDLCGGKADTQIAYINIYQRITVLADPGQALGSDAGEKGDSGYSAKDVTMEGQ
ncbi:Ubiquitin carboxyl-terminal hydrolase 6 [Symbiodinium microadriaticum]|uniref:Ubiquitin carboxyl-terminal hydrolase n=1 Tax=Symbiodinium microadriaticum TaxID=2951 RepID=A0A1Q9F2L3_SYMMI|nr:Ubiquitin carboxyl-terminal hydrolase 6 [Symbiodinium microadriaticum]